MIKTIRTRKLNFAVTVGLRSTFAGNSALLPSDVINFLQCCLRRDFGGKQFHC